MWVFNSDGFFSVVQKKGQPEDMLTIRARSKKDLVNFLQRLGDKKKILSKVGTDYEFRVVVDKKQWAEYLTKTVEVLDYDNFKDKISSKDKQRSQVYMSVWTSLLRLIKQRYIYVNGQPIDDYPKNFYDNKKSSLRF